MFFAVSRVQVSSDEPEEVLEWTGSPPAGGTRAASIDAQLAQLTHLHERGALTPDEVAAAKRRLLGL